MGRADKYKSHVEPFLQDIGRWKSQGLTEEKIADYLKISSSVFQKYKKSHEELKDVLMFGDKKVCSKIYNTIFEQAMGYFKEEVKTRRDKDGNVVYTETVKKYIPPDYRYLVLYLINHDPNFKTLSREQQDKIQRELEIKEKNEEANNW